MTSFRRISILKIDIEGSELELFGGETPWLDHVDNIVIDIHDAACAAAFAKAVSRFTPTISKYGELTCCALNRLD
jgi:hypothetical protein